MQSWGLLPVLLLLCPQLHGVMGEWGVWVGMENMSSPLGSLYRATISCEEEQTRINSCEKGKDPEHATI